jgi:hypothetical protein
MRVSKPLGAAAVRSEGPTSSSVPRAAYPSSMPRTYRQLFDARHLCEAVPGMTLYRSARCPGEVVTLGSGGGLFGGNVEAVADLSGTSSERSNVHRGQCLGGARPRLGAG